MYTLWSLIQNKYMRKPINFFFKSFQVNHTDSFGQTPLHLAILRSIFIDCFLSYQYCQNEFNLYSYWSIEHKRAIELLIEKEANVNAVESRGKMTPLHYIAAFDSSAYSTYSALDSSIHKNWTKNDYLSNSNFIHL